MPPKEINNEEFNKKFPGKKLREENK